MASVGHIAVGLAAARVYRRQAGPHWPSAALWCTLSLLPDLDVIGFSAGVRYGDPWGHRGATHSLVFSIALGVTIGLLAHWFNRPAIRTGLVASLVLASHAALDTMTDGGLGCALWWPFEETRYFAPWRPIPVAPIGPAFFSAAGAAIALTEVVLFGPALIFGLRSSRSAPKRTAAGLVLAGWVTGVWLVLSTDRIRESVVGFLLRENTTFASGFSESAFRRITPGTSDEDVRHLLGPPLEERWIYLPSGDPSQSALDTAASALPQRCLVVGFEGGLVVTTLETAACTQLGVEAGMSAAGVGRLLGPPSESCWRYSRSPENRRYRLRMLCFARGGVSTIIQRWE